MPARIAIADPLPDEIEILPDLEPLERWSADGGVKEEDSGEDTTKSSGAPLPPNPHSNTPTPPSAVPSDYDAVLEERAAQGMPTNGGSSWPPALGPAGDDVLDIDPSWRQRGFTTAPSSCGGRQ